MGSTFKGKLWKFALYFLGSTVLALFYFSQALLQKLASRDPTPWWHYLAIWLVGVYVLALLTIGVLWLGRRLPIQRQNWVRRGALHLVFSFCFSLTDLLIAGAILPRLGLLPSIFKDFASTFGTLIVIDFHSTVIAYWTILGAQAGLRYYREYQLREQEALRLELQASELKTQLARAQLSALKMQLQPHFLFNTLNAITVLVRQHKVQLAEEMLGRLSDLLRCVLEDVEAQEVPLRRELEYLRLYLSIQQVRFQDRLVTNIAADPETLDAAVPQMALQPIVENAIRHGLGRRATAGRIEITACILDGNLMIKVEDDGPGFAPASSPRSAGIGLANTRARLAQLYGDRGQLLTGNRDEGGAVVTLVIPYHLAPDLQSSDVMEVHALHSADR
ncbi:MAG TPA: histidine kinase [Bryobacteraceae bacterium]|jgi:sensor histidine kinase YesM